MSRVICAILYENCAIDLISDFIRFGLIRAVMKQQLTIYPATLELSESSEKLKMAKSDMTVLNQKAR